MRVQRKFSSLWIVALRASGARGAYSNIQENPDPVLSPFIMMMKPRAVDTDSAGHWCWALVLGIGVRHWC